MSTLKMRRVKPGKYRIFNLDTGFEIMLSYNAYHRAINAVAERLSSDQSSTPSIDHKLGVNEIVEMFFEEYLK